MMYKTILTHWFLYKIVILCLHPDNKIKEDSVGTSPFSKETVFLEKTEGGYSGSGKKYGG